MPRPKKPARLWQRKDGRWFILDGGSHYGTGACGDGGRRSAEKALARHIASRGHQADGPSQPNEISIDAVLALHVSLRGDDVASPEALAYSVKALAGYWTGTCDTVKGSTCRAYLAYRQRPVTQTYRGKAGAEWTRTFSAAPSTVRRELAVLQSALNDAHREGVLVYAPRVTLPPSGPPRDRWLTREEVALLIRASAPHVRRFIVLAMTSGRRASAILALRMSESLDTGWIDADAGIVSFEGVRQRRTLKRKGAIQAPRQLAGHLRRWARSGGSHAIMWRGKPVAEIDTGLRAAAGRAGVEGVTPHVLKHTAVTWAFQKGMTLEDAADWFATTPGTLMRVYRQHSPHYQARAREVMERRKRW